MEILLVAVIVLLMAVVVLLILVLRRGGRAAPEMGLILARHEAIERGQERTERGIREEVARNREEAAKEASSQRQELQATLGAFADRVTGELAAMAAAQRAQSQSGEERMVQVREVLETRLAELNRAARQDAEQTRADIGQSLKAFNDSMVRSVAELGNSQGVHLARLTETTDQKLKAMQEENAAKLEQIRRTVDEQLQSTLEKRLGESFKLVSDRLEQVHRGLGEMQNLASGVGDLKKLLSNVRARGTWGEVQLRLLLEQVLTPDQYGVNVATTGTAERVEFAIKLPGDEERPVWLPIDAKFPKEDYERLLDAAERADTAAVEESARQLEARIRQCARGIHEKYVLPPLTTDFGIMYLPCEGLYAEALRRPGLIEALQREYRVTVAGPMTLAAILNSLQMGFRTLAIQKRSSEVWEVLGGVKTEFMKYSEILAKVQKKLQEATNTVDQGLTRTRAIQRKLRDVQEVGTAAVEEVEEDALSLDGPGLLGPAGRVTRSEFPGR